MQNLTFLFNNDPLYVGLSYTMFFVACFIILFALSYIVSSNKVLMRTLFAMCLILFILIVATITLVIFNINTIN